MSFTVEQILKGTGVGPLQSVGQMQVIPVLGVDDETFAPPELEVSTQGYGTVLLRNGSHLPTIVPPGASWVVREKAQDHALGGGSLLRPQEHKTVKTAMCIQQAQGGYIPSAKHALSILPAALRPYALSVRKMVSYSKLWEALTALNSSYGLAHGGGSLSAFLTGFGKQLDEFVAEFELVPHQIGAIVLVAGEVVGIERAPSAAYFASVWTPLVRLCYGSLALRAGTMRRDPPVTRLPLRVTTPSFEGLRDPCDRSKLPRRRSPAASSKPSPGCVSIARRRTTRRSGRSSSGRSQTIDGRVKWSPSTRRSSTARSPHDGMDPRSTEESIEERARRFAPGRRARPFLKPIGRHRRRSSCP